MTTLTITHARDFEQRGYSGAFLGAFRDRLRRRRELKALLSQPDYLLRDIGVERQEIMREAAKPFWL